jgi:F-type H+-transporting ATPase subunit alpha
MRQVAGKLRLDLAQFRALAAFAQFGSDLDRATRAQLERGLRIQEILKQPQYKPAPLHQQVMILWAVTNSMLDEVPVEKIRAWEDGFHSYMASAHPEVGRAIDDEKQLSDPTIEALRAAILEFQKTFVG